MKTILLTIVSLTLALVPNTLTSATNYRTSNVYERLPQLTPSELLLPIESGYPRQFGEPNEPITYQQADRIRSAMTQFFVAPNGMRFGAQNQLPEIRIKTRSAPSSPEVEEVALYGPLDSDHAKQQRSVVDQQPQNAAEGSHKSLRNNLAVFNRHSPRFGKRSVF